MVQKISGAGGTVGVSSTENGKVLVQAEFDSHADALEAADAVARNQRKRLGWLDKIISVDEHFSPKVRRFGETLFKFMAFAGLIVLGLLVGMNSGEAALILLPDAPFPDALLYTFGFVTVPIGLYSLDQYVAMRRDGIKDDDQKPRLTAFLAIAVIALSFDLIGVITSRVAFTTGAMDRITNNRIASDTLKKSIKKGQLDLVMMDTPDMPSAAYAAKLNSLRSASTRTGKPVQTLGELKDLCDADSRSYCFEYRGKFAAMDMISAEFESAKSVEERGPRLREDLINWQIELDALETSGASNVDEFFAKGETAEARANSVSKIRFWRTIVLSVFQVALLAILALMLLDDRHLRLERRRKKRLDEGSTV